MEYDIRKFDTINCRIYEDYRHLPNYSLNEDTCLEICEPMDEIDRDNLCDALKDIIEGLVICNPKELFGVLCRVDEHGELLENEATCLLLMNMSQGALDFLVETLNGMNLRFCGVPVMFRKCVH